VRDYVARCAGVDFKAFRAALLKQLLAFASRTADVQMCVYVCIIFREHLTDIDAKQVCSATGAMRRRFVLFLFVVLFLMTYVVQLKPCD
jgi:hypothetical protein